MTFALSGLKWGSPTNGIPSGPIYWSTDVGSDLSYDTGTYTPADFSTSLGVAFQSWEDITRVDFEPASMANPADITVSAGALPGSTIGQAEVFFIPSPGIDEIVAVDITIDTEEFWSPEGDPGSTDFFAVALHEIGHAIGLEHVTDVTEIMNEFLSTDELGDGDIRGAQRVYGVDGDPIPSGDSGGGEDDGGGGGIIAFLGLGILGILAAIFGAFTGGGAAAGVLAAAATKPTDPENEDIESFESNLLAMLTGSDEPDVPAVDVEPETILLSDLIPVIPAEDLSCGICGTSVCMGCEEDVLEGDLLLA